MVPFRARRAGLASFCCGLGAHSGLFFLSVLFQAPHLGRPPARGAVLVQGTGAQASPPSCPLRAGDLVSLSPFAAKLGGGCHLPARLVTETPRRPLGSGRAGRLREGPQCRVLEDLWSLFVSMSFLIIPSVPPPAFFFPVKNEVKSLGKFMSSPIKQKGNIQLSYSDGDVCGDNNKIQTNITLICKPGKHLFF